MRIGLFKGDFRYDAANAFTDALAAAFTAAGVQPMIVDLRLPSEQFGAQLSALFDVDDLIGLVGVNTLGSSIKTEGQALHEALSVPFVSWLVDHPIFHAGRLTALQGQPTLCVDQNHVRFLEGLGVVNAHYAPLAAASPPDYYSAPRWAERPGRVLLAGSFDTLDNLRRRFAGVIAHDRAAVDAGIPALSDAFEALADEGPFTDDQAVIDAAAFHPLTFSVQQFLGVSAHYATLLQCLILWHRAKTRLTILRQLDDAGLAVDLAGDGWEAAGFKNHRVLGGKPFSELHPLFAQYRFVLNAAPLFGDGLHNQIVYGAFAGAVVCTDENPQSRTLIGPGGALGYAPGDASALPAAIDRLDKTPEGAAMAALGREIVMFNHAWGVRARQILTIIGR